MPSITDIFTEVSAAIQGFIGSLGEAMNSVTSLFWDASATTPHFTFLGVLILIGVGAGLVYGCYRLIKGLLHRV